MDTCALSGIVAPECEELDGFTSPVGWTEVIVRQRVPNPEHAEILGEIEAIADEQVASAVTAATASGETVTDEMTTALRATILRRLTMQFHSVLSATPAEIVLDSVYPLDTTNAEVAAELQAFMDKLN